MPDGIPTFEESIMPRTTIKACAKTVLHSDTAIQKDALTALAKGSSVFISYLTTHANEIALSKKRKTIMPSDVLEALKVIELDRFIPDLQRAHERSEAENKEKRDRKKSGASVVANVVDDDVATQEDESQPLAKRPRVENGDHSDMQPDVQHRNTEEDEPAEDIEEDDLQDEEDEEEEEEAEDEEEDDEDDQEEGDGNVFTEKQLPDDAAGDLENRQRDDYDEALDNGDESD